MAASATSSPTPARHLSFEAVPGIFTDFSAACAADPTLKIATQPSLALIDRTYPSDDPRTSDVSTKPWERLAAYVASLNRDAEKGTSYKVVYLSRHGIGFHNVMQAKVGTEQWDVSVFSYSFSVLSSPFFPFSTMF
jgi:hypothetical protein